MNPNNLMGFGLPYHSPHKFRHGHIHYGLEHAKDIEDLKAVSMKITDEFYSNLDDVKIEAMIRSLGKEMRGDQLHDEILQVFLEFLEWKKEHAS